MFFLRACPEAYLIKLKSNASTNGKRGEASSQFWQFTTKNRNTIFGIFCSHFGAAVVRIFNKSKNIFPWQIFWKP